MRYTGRMRIRWTQVTWYSRLLALLLLILLPFAGFWLGVQYGRAKAVLDGTPSVTRP